ncbi:MAG TPA: aminodeoxychorismate synthase component I [Candidatus Kryptonia bacterium]|nr:aminodeoxychorismate synthase component I [Candidatus Kryptonia bacterium]
MPTQELDLDCTPAQWLLGRVWRRPFVFDGGGHDSWAHGCALVGHAPRATLRVDADGGVEIRDGDRRQLERTNDPLAVLDRFRHAQAARRIDDAPGPLAGGLVVALSYDLKHSIEQLPSTARDDQALPLLECGWYDWGLVFDHRARSWRLQSAYLTEDELAAVGRDLRGPYRRRTARPAPTQVTSNFTREAYRAAVDRALAYIAAGDIYQVNLAQRFETAQSAASADLFARLQRQHPMPFAAFLDCDDFAIVSNSPECFLSLQGDTIATFPIKGTRPRGADNPRDVANAQTLRCDPKEAAEHVMIVDLERNDLGRVCRPGSVAVRPFAAVHSYPTLHHLVSHVHGQLHPGTSLRAVLRATFPGGSITGAPKIRAMEIIDEFEPVRRGFYTGAIGFIDGSGDGVLNIAIRTAVARNGRVTYHAGGAIVADSDPQREYDETLLKARAFFDACSASD